MTRLALTADAAPSQSFTVADLMARWKVSRKSVLESIRNGRVRAFRPGLRTYRVTLAEVLRVERAQAAND